MQKLAQAVFEDKNLSLLPDYLEGGVLPALVSGLGSSGRANIAAGLRIMTDRPLVVVCANDAEAESMRRDLECFLQETVMFLTGRDINFYAAESVSRENERSRIHTLSEMAKGKAGALVCTFSGLVQRTMPKEVLLATSISLVDGESCPPDKVVENLVRSGYGRTAQVEGPGQFSVRGGILDFFSPAYDYPVRCEFWGDEINSMGFFDTSSQRRIKQIEHCDILPAKEVIPALCPRDTLLKGLRELEKQAGSRNNMKLEATLREDSEKLLETGDLASADRYIDLIYKSVDTAVEYFDADALVLLDRPGKIMEQANALYKQHATDLELLTESGLISGKTSRHYISWKQTTERLADFALVMADNFTSGKYPYEPRSIISVTAKQLPSYGGSTETAIEDVRHYISSGYRVVVLATDKRKGELLSGYFAEREIIAPYSNKQQDLPPEGGCVVWEGSLSGGLEYPGIRLAVLTDSQIVGGGLRQRRRKKSVGARGGLQSYADLSVGDLVVHEYYGIGRFAGIFQMPVDGIDKDYIKISYAGTDSLYVPATQLNLVSKYIGGGGEDGRVKLSKLGGADWTKSKARAKSAAKDLAKGLVQLYAERQRAGGHEFAADSPWQTEFEDNFSYQETEDQLRCIEEIKSDMEKPVSMERLLCGDVGYGKTEVALRGVMKCILDGKQAAILAPTTVLAQQHYQTAVQRFNGFPVEIEVLNRYRTSGQVKRTLENMKQGKTDLVIGTHRLLQKDIVFRDLGLLVIDEEQRFGVSHKERLKEISRQVDCLSLSATPIPRTLNMALAGLRDISTIEEPPQDRKPVQTYVMEHDWLIVCDAIKREIMRGGQVYYVHNRIESIARTALRLKKLLGDNIIVAVAHGRMDEDSLSEVMESMVSGETQVLVCTTIIEAGIDIPNVNTIVVEDADRLGLAQLHQIRGRVGRSSRRASAYLTFRKDKVLTEVAEKRLSAIREFAEFNSGFRIAMRDLEIRGAGNLLGAEQSGHLTDVGYDMYLKLLEEAVLEERGETPRLRAECSADVAVSANIPESYVRSSEQRMDLYRRIAQIRTEEEADDFTDELIDRFGDPPASVNSLIHVSLLRGEAEEVGISEISQKSGLLRFGLMEFDMHKVNALYGRDEYKGRLKVEEGTKPCLSLRLRSGKRIIETARQFVADYKAV